MQVIKLDIELHVGGSKSYETYPIPDDGFISWD